jgi:multidrug efflux system outer membrane protein
MIRIPGWTIRRAGATALLVAMFTLAGCMVGPDYQPPETPMPEAWDQELPDGVETGEADLATWWESFGDPMLSELVRKAKDGNKGLDIAVARIREARAARQVAAGELYPPVNAYGSSARSQASENVSPVPLPGSRTGNLHSYGFDSSWELDVFGRIRRSVEAADATVEATEEDYRDVLVTLYAEVALNYVDVRTFQALIRSASGNVEAQRRTMQLTKDRFEADIASGLDVAQAEANLARSEADIPLFRIGLEAAINRLSTLIGEQPGPLREKLIEDAPIPAVPAEIALGVPADLLRRRPDIRAAERQLAAQTARIGVATADLYPRFSLSGFFAFESRELDNLFEGGSLTWGIGPAFRWNLFDGGRIRGLIDIEDARTEQALAVYERSVLLALEEVETSIVSYHMDLDRRAILERAVDAFQRSASLADDLYRKGLTSFLNVLDAQRELFLQQNELAGSQGDVVRDVVRIYKALGGGWTPPPPPEEEPNP